MIYHSRHTGRLLDADGAQIKKVTSPQVLEPSGIFFAHGGAHGGVTVPTSLSLRGDGVWTRHSR